MDMLVEAKIFLGKGCRILFVCALALISISACDDADTLHKAAFSNDTEMAQRLITKGGADVGLRNDQGVMPLHIAATMGAKEVAGVLIGAGADLEAQSDVGTPLYISAYYRHADFVRLLLEAGANVDARSSNAGDTALFGSVRTGDIAIVRLLLRHGAWINATDRSGATPVDKAALSALTGEREILELLIASGGRCKKLCDMLEN